MNRLRERVRCIASLALALSAANARWEEPFPGLAAVYADSQRFIVGKGRESNEYSPEALDALTSLLASVSASPLEEAERLLFDAECAYQAYL